MPQLHRQSFGISESDLSVVVAREGGSEEEGCPWLDIVAALR